MTDVLTRREHAETEIQRDQGHMTMEAEIRVMQLQSKDCQEPPETKMRHYLKKDTDVRQIWLIKHSEINFKNSHTTQKHGSRKNSMNVLIR